MRTSASHSISLLLALLAVAHIDAFQLNIGRIIRIPSPSNAFQRFSPNPSSSSKSILLSQTATTSLEDSKCPVTQFGNRVTRNLGRADKYFLSRLIRIANHVPALMSLSYFGLISMASMMSMGPMKGGCDATLSNVLTRIVGATTNAEFAALFPTLVTPASFVFLVWPLIAVLQLITVSISAIFPGEEEILSQSDLSALTIANLCSSAWLISSSNALAGALPLSSFLVLPLVPIFSGYPLRNKPKYILWAFQVYSSFTTIASMLAFTVEIQHGGRIPLIGKVGAEVASLVFLSLYSLSSLSVANKTVAKRLVNFGALSGILYNRVTTVMSAGALSGFGSLALSVSFLGTVGCWFWSVKSLFASSSARKMGFGSSKTYPPLTTAPHSITDKFMGTWFVIGVKPTPFETSCSNAVETYTRVTDTKPDSNYDIKVDFQYNKSDPITSPLKSMGQKGWIQGSNKNDSANWLVSPSYIPIKLAYPIIEVDAENYQYAVIGNPQRNYVWILSRTPTMEDELYESMKKKLVENHQYDLEGLRKVPQKWTRAERAKRKLEDVIPDEFLEDLN